MHEHNTPPSLLPQIDQSEYDDEYKHGQHLHPNKESGKSKQKKREISPRVNSTHSWERLVETLSEMGSFKKKKKRKKKHSK